MILQFPAGLSFLAVPLTPKAEPTAGSLLTYSKPQFQNPSNRSG
jgi:hypothetical protein